MTRPRFGRVLIKIAELAQKIGATVLIDGHMIDIRERNAAFIEAIGDGLRREARPMLDATEALLLGRGDENAVAHERGRRVAVEGVETENNHASINSAHNVP